MHPGTAARRQNPEAKTAEMLLRIIWTTAINGGKKTDTKKRVYACGMRPLFHRKQSIDCGELPERLEKHSINEEKRGLRNYADTVIFGR